MSLHLAITVILALSGMPKRGANPDPCQDMDKPWLKYWTETMNFDESKYPNDWGYKLKTTRCPGAGMLEPCPDTLTRTVLFLCSWCNAQN